VGQKALTAVRGGYGGVLMFGMVGQWLGLAALTGPGAAPMMALGMLMGRKQLGEEQDRALAQRRAQAKSAVRQYVDDASFNVGKDSRDTLRRIQRQLRDHFADQAEEFHRSTTETLLATQQAAQMESEGRARRLRDVEAELARLADLRQRAAALAPDLAVAP
jgi:hypothetical protein